MSQETIEKTFPVTVPARLKLSNIRGSVQIEAGEDGLISVSATKHLNSGNASRTEILMSQAEDGKVIVETKYGDWFFSFFNFSSPCKVDYVVRVPHSCEIDTSGVSNSLLIQSVEGGFNISTVSGEMSFKDLRGDLHLSSVSGNVSGEDLSGKLHLNTVSGDVRLAGGDLSQGKVSTVSGDIQIRTAMAKGPYTFKSVSGDVHLAVTQEVGFSVNLQSVSGVLHTALPLNHRHKSGGTLTAEIGGGEVEIGMNSVSGNLYLEAPQPPIPQENPAPASTTRREVLERISRGEMSVEEGIEKLKSAS
jgi:hypothetical protein